MVAGFHYHVPEDHTHQSVRSLSQKYDPQSQEYDPQSCSLDS